MDFEAPRRLVRALAEGDGTQDDTRWLDGLPELFARTVDRAGLGVERVVAPGGRGSLVVLVHLPDGTPAALKLAPPSAATGHERTALESWDGSGAVRFLAPVAGPDGGPEAGLLLERLHPEVSVRSLPEAKAILEAAGTLRRLWVEPPAGHGLGTVEDRTAAQAGRLRAAAESDEVVAPLIAAALAVREELLAAPESETFLLHGCFHQGKVLAGDRAPWLAVGPAPLVGERAYDLARLARDRAEDLVATTAGPSTARRRVGRLADSLDLDRDRVLGWTLFRTVTAAVSALRAGRAREAEPLLEFASWL
ncbi:aminoglycoside phosphotransferase family protein [Streptomyces qinzhouensis]|uniref:Kinase n=1 Tax=Streptomyces qinzhouensis TaxID=2599401 RepID=A0A5B8JNS5_9ACTN|nr:aminoglycoside phosphotransferase family protein [Streptomyces qinzhouensis]QDY79293.1 kinase [Streptomyces qinzhouensis]